MKNDSELNNNMDIVYTNIYSIHDYNKGKVPTKLLEDDSVEIILINTKKDTNVYVTIPKEVKCNFTLKGAGKYDISGNRTVIISSSHILLTARDNVNVFENSNHRNNVIILYNNSKMNGFSADSYINGTIVTHGNLMDDTLICAYDNSYVNLQNIDYAVKFFGKSKGIINGGIRQIVISENSCVNVNNIYSFYLFDKLKISVFQHGKLFGNIHHNDNVHLSVGGCSTINVTGNGHIDGHGNSFITCRGEFNINVHCSLVKINTYFKCIVHVHIPEYNIVTIDDYINNMVKLYGNSIISKKVSKYKLNTIDEWIKYYGVDNTPDCINPQLEVILYKKVSYEFKTQEGTENETNWMPGTIVEMPMDQWNPKTAECGEGKFHACGNPLDCLLYRSNKDDKFIAIKVKKEDIFLWINHALIYNHDIQHPSKITFRKGEVLYECDSYGNRIVE